MTAESSDEAQEASDSGSDLSQENVAHFLWRPHRGEMPVDKARAELRDGGEVRLQDTSLTEVYIKIQSL